MNRLVRRQRAALALFIAMTVSGIGVALADPQGEQPGRTIDVSPTNGQNLPSSAPITVTGMGFSNNNVGTSGIIVQTAELPNGTSAVSTTLGTFTSNTQGNFSSNVTVSQTFTDAGSGAGVDCNAAGVQCFVQATSNSGNFNAAHTLSFAGGSTTLPPTTVPPTTLPPTTLPPTTLPPTTLPPTTLPPTTLPPTTLPPTTLPPTTLPPTTLPPTTLPPTTLPPTTVPPTTVPPTTVPPTTAPPTTTTPTTQPATTTTIGGPTTTLGPAGCAALRQARANLNAQIDAARASVIAANLPPAQQAAALAQLEAIRAQGNAQIDARLVSCPPAP